MGKEEPGSYSHQEFRREKEKALGRLLSDAQIRTMEQPRAMLLGGQSGAGKTRLHAVAKKTLKDNAIVINGDEYRALHPRYHELDAEYGLECVKHTAKWAGQMAEELIDALSTMGYNLVIEGTLRTNDVPLRTATLLRNRGYTVSLACMAVKPEISLVSCRIRYERMHIAGTVLRATDPEHHNAIVHDIADNIAVLEGSGLFEEIGLYDRFGDKIYPKTQEARSAQQALQEVLFGKWTSVEKSHYVYLCAELEKLKQHL